MQLTAGRVAVVTGAGSGIGRALAEAAARAGLTVVASDVNAEAVEAVAEGINAGGGAAQALVADVSRAEDIERIADVAFEAGSVQLICSNAGIVVPGRAWEISAADWQRVLDINFMATVHLARAFVPRLLEAGGPARLLVTGSMACVTARPFIGPYVASKHALLGLCEVLQHELATTGAPVGVSLVFPGRVHTAMSDGSPGAISADEVARIALDAVADDRLFTFTQDDRVPEVERRFADLLAGRTPAAPG